MQELKLNQLSAISGGGSGSFSNVVSSTISAFQNGLSDAELGVGAVSFFVGLLVGGASFLGLSGRGAVMLSVAGYAIHSHFGLNLLSNMSLPSLPNWNFPVPPSTTNS